MTKNKSPSKVKNEKYLSFEEMKKKLFPDLVLQEEKDLQKDDFKLLGITWANESIDKILATSN